MIKVLGQLGIAKTSRRSLANNHLLEKNKITFYLSELKLNSYQDCDVKEKAII